MMRNKQRENKLSMWDRIFNIAYMSDERRADEKERIREADAMEKKRREMETVFRNMVDDAKTREDIREKSIM